MPDTTHTDRIRTLLQAARQALDSLSSTLGEIEGELAAMEQEAATQTDYQVPVDQEEPIVFTQEETEIMPLKMLLNVNEAAFLLGVKPAEVCGLIREGELPVCKIGRAVRVPTRQLQEYISKDGRPSPVEEEITIPKKGESKRIQKNHAARVIHREKKAGQKTNTPDSKDETPPINKKSLLTVEEAAVVLRMHKISVYQLVSQNKLPSCRIGRSIRIPRKQLEEYIQAARAGEREE